jgi:hypothetical protein
MTIRGRQSARTINPMHEDSLVDVDQYLGITRQHPPIDLASLDGLVFTRDGNAFVVTGLQVSGRGRSIQNALGDWTAQIIGKADISITMDSNMRETVIKKLITMCRTKP